jgi:hypothetical protein
VNPFSRRQAEIGRSTLPSQQLQQQTWPAHSSNLQQQQQQQRLQWDRKAFEPASAAGWPRGQQPHTQQQQQIQQQQRTYWPPQRPGQQQPITQQQQEINWQQPSSSQSSRRSSSGQNDYRNNPNSASDPDGKGWFVEQPLGTWSEPGTYPTPVVFQQQQRQATQPQQQQQQQQQDWSEEEQQLVDQMQAWMDAGGAGGMPGVPVRLVSRRFSSAGRDSGGLKCRLCCIKPIFGSICYT